MRRPARRVVARLRSLGHSADSSYASVKVGKALKVANQAGARYAVLVGPEEWQDESVRVKDLESLMAIEETQR